MVTRIQILDEAVYISHGITCLGKGMHPIILSLAMGKIVEQTGLFSLGMPTDLGKGKLTPIKLRLEIALVLHPPRT